MNLLHDLLSLTALLSLLALIAQRNHLSKRPQINRSPTAPPDISLLDLTRRQLADWQNLLIESENNDVRSEQVDYCRQQVRRFEAELTRLDQQAE